MTRISLTALALSAGLVMSACSPTSPEDEPVRTASPDNETALADAKDEDLGTDTDALMPDDTAETGIDPVGSEAAAITLQPVRAEDVEGLRGELACAFNTSDSDETLLVARADVSEDARATAAVNNNGFGQQLFGEQLGGFSQIEPTGGTFAGEGLVVVIDLNGDELDGPQTEQSRQSATMTANRADGATRTYDGLWVCGP